MILSAYASPTPGSAFGSSLLAEFKSTSAALSAFAAVLSVLASDFATALSLFFVLDVPCARANVPNKPSATNATINNDARRNNVFFMWCSSVGKYPSISRKLNGRGNSRFRHAFVQSLSDNKGLVLLSEHRANV